MLESRVPSPARRLARSTRCQGYRSLAGSLLLHLAVLGGAVALAHSGSGAAATTPVAFAVQESMFRPDAPPAADAARPPVEVHDEPSDDPPPVHQEVPPDAEPPAAAPHEPPADSLQPMNHLPQLRPEHFARCRVARPTPKPAEATARAAKAEPLPTQAVPSPAASTATPEVNVPEPADNPSPDYPEGARRRGIQGTVVVRIEVTADGAAGTCSVLTTSGSVQLDDAALRAARRWRFRSGPGVVEQPFRFELATARSAE